MKINRRPLLAIIPAAALAGSMLTAPVAGAQSSLPIPEDLLGSASGSLDLGSIGGDTCGTEVVTPDSRVAAGWFTPTDENAATIEALDGAPGEGKGAMALTPDAEKGSSLYKDAGKVKLNSVLDADGNAPAISFKYKSDGKAPALQLRVRNANVVDGNPGGTYTKSNDGFATIVWSPAAGDGTWQDATAPDADDFWVTRTIVKDPANPESDVVLERNKKDSLEDIIAALGADATLEEYGVQQTKDNKTPKIGVDMFTFGCEVTDFEPNPVVDDEDDDTATDGFFGSLENPDFGSLALGGGLALAAALAVGGGAFAIQNGMIQLPPELAALLPA